MTSPENEDSGDREGVERPDAENELVSQLLEREQGHIQHTEEGLKYVYSPTESQTSARRRALDQLVKVFFGGSPGQTVTALLKQEKWSNEELDELHAAIDAARSKGKKS